ncbi:metallophosphoesterase (plasmid) [Rhizobium ruizarguesonis]|uniref:metallophosphoesterase family protein n=1 Tax=Rhizobium ruizarguesonis TaxID=2081791 RepID=UPI00102FED92|nr:metallophosphoesterase [Rhizobium ruizarguesonis]TBB15019.1 metallophosphoesterase [Rhizobium ruizarguesonis]
MKRFLLISDIHATNEDPSSSSASSYVSSYSASASARLDPISELEVVIREDKLNPDYILCPGDITNRSNPQAFTYAWERLNKLAISCGAKLIATIGNHDLDSRYKENRFDPRGYVMSTKPQIPVVERERFLEFWAENFTVISEPDCNIVVVNTAAYHGGGKEVAAEIEHGRISELTLLAIAEAIKRAPKADTNVLLCHHHPIKGDQGDVEFVGQTRGGEKLIETLEKARSSWILIHGHKHVPDIFYGHGGANAPIIVGCASFSAQINADSQNKNPNQFHFLITDPAGARSEGLTTAGSLLSWTWQPGVGWSKASRGAVGLPHFAGFGFRGSVRTLVDRVDEMLKAGGSTYATWPDAVGTVAALERLTPVDFEAFESALADSGLRILSNRDGSPAQIGRSI